jgi:bis(5'-nucleosyl)-tetraphosphatase (symmetrical)
MAVYAIGDVQGCLVELEQLLEALEFDARQDRLWFTGDLVNRGPDSLGVLRRVRDLGDAALTVLGNHDLHLLAVAHGAAAVKRKDTLKDVLEAPDRDELLNWLRHRPLLHHDAALGYVLVHAGLLPEWDLDLSAARAREVEAVLRSDDFGVFFQHMYGNAPDRWGDELTGFDRLRLITNVFTRVRYLDEGERLALDEKRAPRLVPPPRYPWFLAPGRRVLDETVVFGHWSTLGFMRDHGILALDTGCLWGGSLTAVRLDQANARPVAVKCIAKQAIDPESADL